MSRTGEEEIGEEGFSEGGWEGFRRPKEIHYGKDGKQERS